MPAGPSLPYNEPSVATILLQSSFLLLLNLLNSILDSTLYCGLLGQILLGTAFGTPGTKWLGVTVEEVIVQVGYLGLLLLVYEGGLSTSFRSLKANIFLSLGIAVTGIAVPMSLSFALEGLAGATPLQAFAAGAALCATSLGTTFTVLRTSGLTSSRLGVALTSAAMMDDLFGLVMVQVVSNLGGAEAEIGATTVIRPILVSLGFAVITTLVCSFAVKPLTVMINKRQKSIRNEWPYKLLCRRQTTFILETLVLIGLVAGSSYSGSSNLFASYIAGASISWWDEEVPHFDAKTAPVGKANEGTGAPTNRSVLQTEQFNSSLPVAEPAKGHFLSLHVFHTYYHQPLERVLKPLFFASIGFSIPIAQMFRGSIVWRGLIYTILMVFGKLVCGLWLVRIEITPQIRPKMKFIAERLRSPRMPHFWRESATKSSPTASAAQPVPDSAEVDADRVTTDVAAESSSQAERLPGNDTAIEVTGPSSDHQSPRPRKPVSLYPASILGTAMVARGEIGFLISSIAESNGIFSHTANEAAEPSQLYLVITWAIVLCTFIGPLCVGLLVRRVKYLEKRAKMDHRNVRTDILGVWGVH